MKIEAKCCWCCWCLLQLLSFPLLSFGYDGNSPIFQPGHGAMVTLTDTVTDSTLIENVENFKYISKQSFPSQSGMIMAFFVAPVTGTYSFPIDCGQSTSSLHMIDLLRSNIYIKSMQVSMRSGFSYKLKLSFARPSSCELGVTFPNGTSLTPISNRLIYRTMDSYHSWNVLKQLYVGAKPSNFANIMDFHAFTSGVSPSSYILTEHVFANTTNEVALFLSYIETPQYSQTFRLSCDFICEAVIKSRSGTLVNHHLLIHSPTNNSVSVDIPSRQSMTMDVAILGKGRIDVYRTHNNMSDSLYHKQLFLEVTSIVVPSLTAVNSSALNVRLNAGTKLNPRDHWSTAQKYEIVCYKGSTFIKHFKELKGKHPQTVTLSGLSNYTVYKCNAYYFGSINGSDYNFASDFGEGRTAENLPSAAPTLIKATSPEFYSMSITWSAIPAENHEGVLSYTLYYRKESSSSWNVLATTQNLYYTHLNLEEGYYWYKVCGRTGAGYGPCSPEVRAMPSIPRQIVEEARFSSFSTSLHFTNKALHNHITAVHKVNSVDDCHKKCIACQQSVNCCCLSFNLQHLSSGGEQTCEISHETAEAYPLDLLHKDGYQYYSLF